MHLQVRHTACPVRADMLVKTCPERTSLRENVMHTSWQNGLRSSGCPGVSGCGCFTTNRVKGPVLPIVCKIKSTMQQSRQGMCHD